MLNDVLILEKMLARVALSVYRLGGLLQGTLALLILLPSSAYLIFETVYSVAAGLALASGGIYVASIFNLSFGKSK